MTDTSQLRLLPWRSPDGKPCYLSSSNPHSRFSRLADEVEEEQIECGNAVLEGRRRCWRTRRPVRWLCGSR